MRNARLIALLVAPLLGCFAQLEAPGIALSHTLCSGAPCVPGGGANLSVWQVNGNNTFVVSFGDQPLLKPSTDVGPSNLKTAAILNSGAFDLTTSGTDFSGVQTVTLLAVNPGVTVGTTDPCATASNCTTVASYNAATDGTAATHLALKGNGSDLVKLIDQSTHQLTLVIHASGNAPSAPLWNATVSMDMSLNSKASFP